MLTVVLYVALVFGISVLNAWGCGKTWYSTKEKGGLAHFMNWMGAIMASIGFTWVYLIGLAALFSVIPIAGDEGQEAAPIMTPEMMKATFELGYLVIIAPLLGSGLALTISAWRRAARTRSFGDTAIAGWNTYAQISNTMSAIQSVPDVLGSLGKFFGGSSSGDKRGVVVILLVVLAVLGGIMTTFGIIRHTADATVVREDMKAREVRSKAAALGATGGMRTPTGARPAGSYRRG